MRATAFMQRAYSHGRALTDLLQKVMVDMPTQATLDVLDEVLYIECVPGSILLVWLWMHSASLVGKSLHMYYKNIQRVYVLN